MKPERLRRSGRIRDIRGSKLTFSYDGNGRRVSKKVFDSKGELVSDTRFLYSGFKCVAEIDALKERVIRFYQWHGEQLLGVVDVKSGKQLACLTDGNKNVVGLIDNSGAITARYAYSPFGKLLSAKGADAKVCSFGFSSEYRDDESGLVYYNYRYLNPKLGRWMTRDPIGERGGWNQYCMVFNNTISRLDSNGLAPITWVETGSSPREGSGSSCSQISDIGNIVDIFYKSQNITRTEEVWSPGVFGAGTNPDDFREKIIYYADTWGFLTPVMDIPSVAIKIATKILTQSYAEFKWKKECYETSKRFKRCTCKNTNEVQWEWSSRTDFKEECYWVAPGNMDDDMRILSGKDAMDSLNSAIRDVLMKLPH